MKKQVKKQRKGIRKIILYNAIKMLLDYRLWDATQGHASTITVEIHPRSSLTGKQLAPGWSVVWYPSDP